MKKIKLIFLSFKMKNKFLSLFEKERKNIEDFLIAIMSFHILTRIAKIHLW